MKYPSDKPMGGNPMPNYTGSKRGPKTDHAHASHTAANKEHMTPGGLMAPDEYKEGPTEGGGMDCNEENS